MMTIRQAVNWGTEKLRNNNVDNAEHDSFELLSSINGMTRTFYFINGDDELSEKDFSLFQEYIIRRFRKKCNSICNISHSSMTYSHKKMSTCRFTIRGSRRIVCP